MRAELVKAIASGEQKATAAVWKTVASLLETCNDFAGEDTNAELELVNDELAMRSEVEAVLEEMDEALVDLDVAKLGGATVRACIVLHCNASSVCGCWLMCIHWPF